MNIDVRIEELEVELQTLRNQRDTAVSTVETYINNIAHNYGFPADGWSAARILEHRTSLQATFEHFEKLTK